MKKILFGATAAAALSVGGAASAATVGVTINLTEYGSISDAIAAQNSFIGVGNELAYEDFESFCSYESAEAGDCRVVDTAGLATGDLDPGETSNGPLNTALGAMRSLKPEGSGDSSVPPETDAIVRSGVAPDDTMFGRYDADRDVVSGPNNFLDSNDNGGIRLNVPGGGGPSKGMFNQLSMLLTDIDDVGEIGFWLSADDSRNAISISDIAYTTLPNGAVQDDGGLFLATFKFDALVDGVTIDMRIDAGDGFGVDSMSLSQIPLPAAGWMLLAGIGALGAASRRKRKAA